MTTFAMRARNAYLTVIDGLVFAELHTGTETPTTWAATAAPGVEGAVQIREATIGSLLAVYYPADPRPAVYARWSDPTDPFTRWVLRRVDGHGVPGAPVSAFGEPGVYHLQHLDSGLHLGREDTTMSAFAPRRMLMHAPGHGLPEPLLLTLAE